MPVPLKDILTEVVPTLREKGYKGSGQNYRLTTSKAVSIVNFQKSSGADRFYVNVAVQPLLVLSEAGSMVDAKKIKEAECIFRKRLDPPNDDALGWPYATEVSSALVRRFDELFGVFVAPLMMIPGPITEACVEDFSSDSPHPLFGPWNARTFLHFARISLVMENRERSVEFATAGLEICPPRATTLLDCLEKALAEAEATL